MDTVNLPQVLSSLNVLQEFEDAKDEFKGESYDMVRREFWNDKYYIAIYSTSTQTGYDAIWKIYDVLQKAIPEFIRAWKYTENLIIVAWPRYCDMLEDSRYRLTLEELIRFSTWSVREHYLDTDEAVLNVKDYFSMCVSYPGNRK